jgi:hypothetical protein
MMEQKQQAKFVFLIRESTINPPLHSKGDILEFITESCSNFTADIKLTHDGDEISLIIDEVEDNEYTALDKEFRDQLFFTVSRSIFGSKG